MSDVLLPCPFCGVKLKIIISQRWKGGQLGTFTVKSGVCEYCDREWEICVDDSSNEIYSIARVDIFKIISESRQESGELPGWLKQAIETRIEMFQAYIDKLPQGEDIIEELNYILSRKPPEEAVNV